MKNMLLKILGGKVVYSDTRRPKIPGLLFILLLVCMAISTNVFAQGSIFGVVANSDLSTPANSEISFVGYIDDTDEEIRIETSDGAGYDAGNWFDDFQNYLTEAPGNPYDYVFYNTANGQGFQLSALIPNNSFQQENVLLAPVSWPSAVTGLAGTTISSSSVLLRWNGSPGITYHVYRRQAVSNGSLFRLDNPAGQLTDPGVADSFYVDNTVDGVSAYDYVIIAEDASGNWSPHSVVITVNSFAIDAPVLSSISPNSGISTGGNLINLYGSGFDPAGVSVNLGLDVVSATVVSPMHLTIITPPAAPGPVDVSVINIVPLRISNTLANGFTFTLNDAPVLAAIGAQSTTENILLEFVVSAADVDGDIPILTTSALPAGAVFTDSLNGNGLFNWTPGFLDAGVYNVTFYATDGLSSLLVDSEQVQITVIEAGNQQPILAPINDTSVVEGTSLALAVSATDPEAEILTLSTSALPANAVFVDNGDGTGSFTFNPDYTQAGVYNISFYAADIASTDSISVAITIVEAGNQIPVLAAIGPQSILEGLLLMIPVSATDAEGVPVLSTSTLPAGALFADNGDGTGQMHWMPDFTQAGTYNVSFYASDGIDTDSELVVVTVTDAGNQVPVLAAIGAQTTVENVLLTFGVTATDPDGTIPFLTTTTLPTGALFTDNGDGTGSFDWTPSFTDAGAYIITFYALDGIDTDSELVTITVTEAGNQSPLLAAINDTTIVEGTTLVLAVSASDPDAEIPTLSTSVLPANALFADNGDGTGSLTFSPDFTQVGVYNVSFYASDLVATDSISVVITVTEAGNQAPILAPIGTQTTVENVLLSFVVAASDPDGTIPVLTMTTLPAGALFTDNGDGSGIFDWTPSFTQAGSYSITFYATDGIAIDSETVVIAVSEAGNQLPVLAAIGPQSVVEGLPLTIPVSATDAEGIPVLSTSTLPTGALFTDNGDGTGLFDWTPTFTDSGTYIVIFYATDGLATDSEIVTITVIEAGNQIPVLAAIGPQGTTEGVLLSFGVSATDGEGIPALSTSLLPTGALFTDNGDGTGLFDWTPDFTQAGTYNVTFYASDGVQSDSEQVTITVTEAGNQVPVLAAIGPLATTEIVQLLVNISATDPDGTIPTLSTSTLPTGALFTDNGDGTGLFDWTPTYFDAGTYNVTFYAADGLDADSEQVTITVIDAGNQPPILAAIGPQATTENIQLTFLISATDPEGTPPILTTSTLPAGAVLADSGNGVGLFDWTPDFNQAGTYNITFYASDGVAVDSEIVTITVAEAGNQPPLLTLIGNQFIIEGAQLLFGVTAADPESIPTLTTSALPFGATFVDSANGSGLFDWTPDFTQAGTYLVTFYASDGIAIDSEQIVITVSEAGQQPPVVTAVADTSVIEGDVLVVVVNAVDPDGGAVFITANHRLNNYIFVDSGNGTAVLTYSPDFFDGGIDTVVFLATDFDTPQQSGQAVTVITTVETNQPPAFEYVGPQNVEVNHTLTIVVRAHDSTDANILHLLYLSALNLPLNATFVDNGDKTGTFTFTPQPGQEGVDTVTFVVTDQGNPQLTTNMPVVITVQTTNSLPVLAPIGPQTVMEGNTLTLNLSAADPDGNIPYFTVDTSNLEGNATFVDNGDGTAVFTFTPSFVQAGLVYVTFFAHDGIDFVNEVVLIQVYESGDQPPAFNPLPAPSVTEGQTGTALITAYDPDGLDVTIFLVDSVLPPNFTFFDSGNGSAVLTMTPDFTQNGVYILTLGVSDGTLADTSTLVVTIIDAGNQPPVLDPITDYTTDELVNLTFGITSSDLDGIPILSMSSATLPAAATLTDNGDGTGTFDWTPGFFDGGTHSVMFYATDDANPLLVDSQQVYITVYDVNQTPIYFFPLGQIDTVSEGDTIWYTIIAQDPDLTVPVVTAFLDGTDTLATNMVLDSTYIDVANNWRVSVLRFAPDFAQGGEPLGTFYQIRFKVCDEMDAGLCVITTPVAFQVYNLNLPPQLVFQPDAGPFTITEGTNLQVTVIATDDAGFADSLIARNLPVNATFTGQVSYRKTLDFTPGFLQAGSYQVTFAAWDNDGDSVVQAIDITVVEAGNQAPIITNVIGDTTLVFVGDVFLDTILATDPELDSTELMAVISSPNMGFSWTGSGGSATGLFTFVPDVTESFAIFQVMYIANDFPAGSADTAITYYRVIAFMRGDSDSDFQYTMNDIVYLIKYLFDGGQAPDPLELGDVDANGAINVADIAYLVNFMYGGGPPPPQ